MQYKFRFGEEVKCISDRAEKSRVGYICGLWQTVGDAQPCYQVLFAGNNSAVSCGEDELEAVTDQR